MILFKGSGYLYTSTHVRTYQNVDVQAKEHNGK